MLNTGRLAAHNTKKSWHKEQIIQTDDTELSRRTGTGGRTFRTPIRQPEKNIDDCCTFIINQVRQSGCNGFADEEIYSMALHYYDEEDIDIGKTRQLQG